jgi:hypothetical protein
MALTNNIITTVLLDVGSSSKRIEAIAATAIYPGFALTFTSAAIPTFTTLTTATDGEQKYLLIAIEDIDSGGGLGVGDPYPIGSMAKCVQVIAGDLFLVRYQPVGAFAIGAPIGHKTTTQPGQFEEVADNNEALCYAAEADAGGTTGRLVAVFAK